MAPLWQRSWWWVEACIALSLPAEELYDIDFLYREFRDWEMPQGIDGDTMQAVMSEQFAEDEKRKPARAKKQIGVSAVITNGMQGPAFLFKRSREGREESLGKIVGDGGNMSIKAKSGDVLLLRGGRKEFHDALLRRWELTREPSQQLRLDGRGSPQATHAYFELIGSSLEELQARAFDAASPPPERALAVGAALQHSPFDEALRDTHMRLVLASNIIVAQKWKHYSKAFHPFKAFLTSRAAKSTGHKKGSKQVEKGGSKKVQRMSEQPMLFAAEGFLEPEEAVALAQTAESIFARVPPPLVCFDRGEADMRAVLAASKDPARDRWRILTKNDFLLGSNCLNQSASKDLLSGSPPTLGVPPKTVDSFAGGTENVLLETVSRRLEKQFGLLPQNGQDFMWVSYDPGADYMPHTDCLKYREGRKMVYNLAKPEIDRFATVLISLNDDLEGGETVFPELNLSFSPKAGRALIWWNINPNTGTCDKLSTHVAREVKSGRKLILMRWYQYHPVFWSNRNTPIGGFAREPFQPEVSCDIGQAGGLSCRHYSTLTHNGDGGGNVPIDDAEEGQKKTKAKKKRAKNEL